MNIKQLLCLLVLAVSGNTFGSNGMPTQPPVPLIPINVTDMANQHFAPLMQGMTMQHPIMMKMQEICKVLNADLMKQCVQLTQDAYAEGVKAGLMAAGTHMQAAMTAMGNVVKSPKK
jgi:hypothetical protein